MGLWDGPAISKRLGVITASFWNHLIQTTSSGMEILFWPDSTRLRFTITMPVFTNFLLPPHWEELSRQAINWRNHPTSPVCGRSVGGGGSGNVNGALNWYNTALSSQLISPCRFSLSSNFPPHWRNLLAMTNWTELATSRVYGSLLTLSS